MTMRYPIAGILLGALLWLLAAIAVIAQPDPVRPPLDHAVEAVTLAWDNPEGTASNRVYRGREPGNYTWHTLIAATGQATIPVDGPGDWYFAVTAISAEGIESDYSAALHWPASRPDAPSRLRRIITLKIEIE